MSIDRPNVGIVYRSTLSDSFEGPLPELTRGLELAATADELWSNLAMTALAGDRGDGLRVRSEDGEVTIGEDLSPIQYWEFGMKQLDGGVWRFEERTQIPGIEQDGDGIVQFITTYSTDPRVQVCTRKVVGKIGMDRKIMPIRESVLNVTDMNDEITGRLIRQMQEFIGKPPTRDEAVPQTEARGVKGSRWLKWLFRK